MLSPKLLISYLDLGCLIACVLSPHFPNSLGMAPQRFWDTCQDDVEGLSSGKRERLLRALYKDDVTRWAWVRRCHESRICGGVCCSKKSKRAESREKRGEEQLEASAVLFNSIPEVEVKACHGSQSSITQS